MQLTFERVRVCRAASTLAKLPFPRVCPVRMYLPMHRTYLEDPDPLLDELGTADGGRGAAAPSSFCESVICIFSFEVWVYPLVAVALDWCKVVYQ